MKYQSNRKSIDAALQRGMANGLEAAATHYQSRVKQAMSKHASNRGNGGSASPPGTPPGVRSGNLRRSVQIDRSQNKGPRPRVRVGTNVEYAPIHEFGGTIAAKGGGLAVPIHPDAKRASEQGRGPRDFADLIFIPRAGKPPLLVRDTGGQWDIMYVLPKRVILPARPVWRPTFKRELKTIKAIIRRGVDAALDRVAGLPGLSAGGAR
ncbi:MAG: HK97 gp10 family phage protein [Planctomycetota bacterium]